MITYLPYPNYDQTAAVLDSSTLGAARGWTRFILRVVTGHEKAFQHHPSTLMWLGYAESLSNYGCALHDEHNRRGLAADPLIDFEYYPEAVKPPWLGDRSLHLSHQSNLLRKLPAHYAQHFPKVSTGLEYHWPIRVVPNPKAHKRYGTVLLRHEYHGAAQATSVKAPREAQ